MPELIAQSGAKIVINMAPWPDAKRLKKAVEKEIAGAGISIDLNADASALLKAVLLVDSSDAVDAALWPCLARCTRDGQKITEMTFEDADARGDYYDIILECAKVNFGPLVKSLISKLPVGLLGTVKNQAESAPQ